MAATSYRYPVHYGDSTFTTKENLKSNVPVREYFPRHVLGRKKEAGPGKVLGVVSVEWGSVERHSD